MSKLKQIVKGNYAQFQFYRGGQLWYKIDNSHLFEEIPTGPGSGNLVPIQDFIFPIPIEDTGSGTFESEMKAITLMRWIRKALKQQEQ